MIYDCHYNWMASVLAMSVEDDMFNPQNSYFFCHLEGH